MKTDEDQYTIKQYLLGSIGDAEREMIEEHIITDPDYIEKVMIVECELIDEYLTDALSEADRRRFIEHFLSTARQAQKLDFVKALANYTSASKAHSPPISRKIRLPAFWKGRIRNLLAAVGKLRLSLIAAIMLIVFVTSLVVIGWWIAHRADQSLESELAQLNNPDKHDPRTFSNFFIIGPLMPGLVRDFEQAQKNAIPKDKDIVQLQLEIGLNNYPIYEVALQRDEGRQVFTVGGLKPDSSESQRMLILYLPSRILTAGDYQLKLSGVTLDGQLEYIGQYVFRIVEK